MTRASAGSLRALATAALVALIGSCAPRVPRPEELDARSRAARYETQLATRIAAAGAVDARALVWAEVSGRRLPAAEATLAIGAPDSFRLRVSSLFGTALDLAARADSVIAWIPARRSGLRLDAERDGLGLARPGGLAVRTLGALWRPPEAAWDSAVWSDSLLVVRWLEGGDTLAAAVGAAGLPAWVTLTRPGTREIRAAYPAWSRGSGAAWPETVEIDDAGGTLHVVCKLTRIQFPERPDPRRFEVRVPADASELTLEDLRRMLERLGTP